MELLNFLIDKWYLSLPFLVFLNLFIFSFARRGGKRITSVELVSLANSGHAQLIDLRKSDLYDQGRITGSKNIPYDQLNNRLNELNNDEHKPIILICDLGNQSPSAGELLQKEGFANTLILSGGINQWTMDNLPLVND
jgi:rhodanese-related sulfurtransferase